MHIRKVDVCYHVPAKEGMTELWPICPAEPQAKHWWRCRCTCDRWTPCSAWHSCARTMVWTSPGCPKPHEPSQTILVWPGRADLSCKKTSSCYSLSGNITYFCQRRQNLLDFSLLSHNLHLLKEGWSIPLVSGSRVTITYPPQLLASPQAGKLELNGL